MTKYSYMSQAAFSLQGVDLGRPFAVEVVGQNERRTLEAVASLRSYLRGRLPNHIVAEIEASPSRYLLEVTPPASIPYHVMDVVGQALGPILPMLAGTTVTARRRNG